jgi:hypothetical protein
LRERGAGGKHGKAGECSIKTSEFHQAISLVLAIIVLAIIVLAIMSFDLAPRGESESNPLPVSGVGNAER